MDEKLAETLKYLRLGGLLANWDEYLSLAQKKRLSPVGLLKHVLEEEHRIKSQNARELRLKRAKIPELLVMETFPFERQPKLNRKKILSLYSAGLNLQALMYPVLPTTPCSDVINASSLL